MVAESVWVLDRSYRFTRAEIAAVLRKLLTARHVAFESSDRIARALRAFEAGRGGFADYLIWDHAHASGCDRIATFDAALLGDPGFFSP